MKFALVNRQRQEAQPNLSGNCQTCDHPMVAKCGEVRIWHWAHLGGRHCDPWWENETQWHRAWKGRFPVDWQEVVHRAETGEKHISDVKTDRGWVIEFQHSYLKPEERRSRDAFYPKLIWVVDGTRRKRDAEKFFAAWHESSPVANSSFVRRLRADECALVHEWADSHAPIFLDFGDVQGLWWVTPGRSAGSVYVAPFPHADFVKIHRSDVTQKDLFDELVKKLSELVAAQEALRQSQAMNRAFPQPTSGGLPPRSRRRGRF
jgi:competence protein CoiA